MLSEAHDVGAKNERRLVAVVSNKESGFEVVHGMLNRVMEVLGVPLKVRRGREKKRRRGRWWGEGESRRMEQGGGGRPRHAFSRLTLLRHPTLSSLAHTPHSRPHTTQGTDEAWEARCGGSYHWDPSNDPAFFPGRQAKIFAFGKEVGIFGVVHPEVLAKFEIPYAVSALELNLEPFCFDQFYRPI
jgi:phenylalanyl-tRNA synthetase beta subunit